jgi:hypothetical protein
MPSAAFTKFLYNLVDTERIIETFKSTKGRFTFKVHHTRPDGTPHEASGS